MNTIKISAFDTLFFRDGKPFSRGEDVWANGMFPPNPSVLYGTLRTMYYSAFPEELYKTKPDFTGEEPTGKLSIKNYYIFRGDKAFYPAPLDMAVSNTPGKDILPLELKEDHLTKPIFHPALTEEEKVQSISSSRIKHFLTSPATDPVDSLNDQMISFRGLRRYLAGNTPQYSHFISNENFISVEPKTGIARSALSGTSLEGNLYRVGMNRPKWSTPDKGNVVETTIFCQSNFESLWQEKPISPDGSGLMKMGGDGKAVFYEKTENITPFIFPELKHGDIFKVYLSTPAIFDLGWLPGKIGKDFIWEEDGFKAELIGTCLGKFKSIGGYDMAKRAPKYMYRAVPAGSVYFFRFLSGEASELKDRFHAKSISDKRSKEGFGISYVGAMNNQTEQ